MKNFTLRLLLLVFTAVLMQTGFAQTGVLDPSDPIVTYDPSNPPTLPAKGVMKKWVRTSRMSFNTSSFKSYIYNGIQFRLKFPKSYQHNVNDGKKYPVFIFLHGLGEGGTYYDNEYQLYHGGEVHMNAVDNGQFDGFLLYPQSTSSKWGNQFATLSEIVMNYLVPQVKADPFRVSIDGLSGGGQGDWMYINQLPKDIAACLPISASKGAYLSGVQNWKYTPFWQFQGGLDSDPTLSSSQGTANQLFALGANYKFTVYPNVAHGCWYNAWAEPDYFPFLTRAYKANPWVIGGRTEFCPGDAISTTVGVTPGFDAYEWRKDGNPISGATSNTINVTAIGNYDCRILRGTIWSDWSRIPVVIKLKTATITPDIQLTANSSKYLPVLDGSGGVKLEVPEGYASYEWRKDTSSTSLGSTRFLTATTSGNYKVRVTEQYGCSSNFSNIFKVIDSNSPNGPAAPTNLTATATGITSLKLNWNQSASPVNNETGFEIYQATAATGPYKLVTTTAADVSTYSDNDLNSFTTYYFKLRAVNNNAASQVTNPVAVTTLKDTIAPTTPVNLQASDFTRSQVTLSWNASMDDVGVTAYDIYINGVKSYVTSDLSYIVNALQPNVTYNFVVKAKDFQGNTSPASNQVTASTSLKGLTYKYYEGTWSVLPDFTSITPVETGLVSNIDISNAQQSENYGFLFQGYIKAPYTGTYTFRTTSDDGNKLYVNTDYSSTATAVVNNDGTHGTVSVDGNIALTAGTVYKIALAYFQQGGGANCSLLWKVPGSTAFVAVPDSAFTDGFVAAGSAPAAPSNLVATAKAYNKINLQWSDNSSNETGFEIFRSTSASGTFTKVALTAANATTYSDSSLSTATTYYYRVRAVGKYGESNYNDGATSQLTYSYYEGNYSVLPNFSALTPVKTGNINNFDISVADAQDYFAFKFDGIIRIPTNGSYTFYTRSDDGSQLFVDGNLVVNNDGLHGNVEQSGTLTLTSGIHNIRVTFFEQAGGQLLNVNWQGPSIAKQLIPDSVLKISPVNATTLALPGAPAVPGSLTASAESTSSVHLAWTSTDSTITKFEVYRSTTNNSFYTLVNSVVGGSLGYSDSSLTPNTKYFYKVRANNVSGFSAYSNEVSATTLNNIPVIVDISDKSIRYDAQFSQNISATDADNETLSISFINLPAFGSFVANGNGSGVLNFNPNLAALGTYTIGVVATDLHGGSDTTTFRLTINNNQAPVLDSIPSITVVDGSTATVNITGTYPSGTVTVTANGLPAFATLVNNGNNSYSLEFSPVTSQIGAYNNISVTAINADSAGSTKTFNVTVVPKPSKNIYVEFNMSSGGQPTAPWNNTKGINTAGATLSALKDETGTNTGASLTLVEPWSTLSTFGATGNNVGIYADNIIKTGYGETTASTRHIQLNNLPGSAKYNLVFFGSRSGGFSASDNKITKYTAGGQTVQQNSSANISQTVQINNITPDANGGIQISVDKDPNNVMSCLNFLIIQSVSSTSTTVISAPASFAATALTKDKIKVSWTSANNNTETGYELWRAATANGAYAKIATLAGNVLNFTDSTLPAATAYYYKVKAVVSSSKSSFSGSVTATTLANTTVPPVNVSATATWTDKIKVTWAAATGTETGFEVWRSDLSTGTYTKIATLAAGIFSYTDSLLPVASTFYYKVRSSFGSSYSDYSAYVNATTFNNTLPSIYVNFTPGSVLAGAPWNNSTGAAQGSGLTNLKDETNAGSGINLTLEENWTGTNTAGISTGNNSGMYPDNVIKTMLYESSSAVRHIMLSGLSTNKKYDFTFSANRGGGASASDTRITYYSVGSQTVQLAATAANVAQTVQIKGISPDVNGQIELSIVKDSLSLAANIGALVITQHLYDGTPYVPENLVAAGVTKNKIQLNWSLSTIDQTSIEVWRSASQNGTYTKIATIAGGATTYADSNLALSSIFFYKVRAAKAGLYSTFSNTAGASTLAYALNINFNDGSVGGPAQPGAWNNTNQLLEDGFVLNNMITDEYVNTGIAMTVVENFNGFGLWGKVTGNNSGPYPDNVIKSNYFTEFTDTARLRFSGLNQGMVYSFVFFGSTTFRSGTITVYQIGNQTITLDSWQNSSKTVTLSNIQPDADGNVDVKVYSTVGYGILNAMSILASPSPNPTTLRKISKNNVAVATLGNKASVSSSNSDVEISAYPNPFVDNVVLKLNLKESVNQLTVLLTDISGKPLQTHQFSNLSKGIWQKKIGLNGKSLNGGVYFMRILGLPGEKEKVIKLLR